MLNGKMSQRALLARLGGLCAWLIAGCGRQQGQATLTTSTPTRTEPPPTLTPKPTVTAAPTATSLPRPTPTPQPTAVVGVHPSFIRTAADTYLRMFGEEQRISVPEALRAHTIGAAYAAHEEKIKGSIEVGKLADLAVWQEDPYSARLQQLHQIPTTMTIIGGKVVYQA